jgi:hypothetical protein
MAGGRTTAVCFSIIHDAFSTLGAPSAPKIAIMQRKRRAVSMAMVPSSCITLPKRALVWMGTMHRTRSSSAMAHCTKPP